MPIRHVIIDRDVLLIPEAPPGGSAARPEDWVWIDGALESLRLLAAANLRVSITTDQPAVARGEVASEAVDEVHRRLQGEAAEAGGRIDGIFVCPHRPDDGCDCYKPAPGLILAAVEAGGIAPGETVVVGDDVRSLKAARAAGVRAALVRTGRGMAAEAQLGDSGVRVYDDALAFVRTIVSDARTAPSEPLAPPEPAIRLTIREAFDGNRRVMAAAAEVLPDALEQLVETAAGCLRAGGKLLVCGSGSSAGAAQRLAAGLMGRPRVGPPAAPAVAITTDTPVVATIASHHGFEQAFARQVGALARPGDLLLAISAGDEEANLVAAARQARAAGCTVAALIGASRGRLSEEASVTVAVPSDEAARVQEAHGLCIHILAAALEGAVSARP